MLKMSIFVYLIKESKYRNSVPFSVIHKDFNNLHKHLRNRALLHFLLTQTEILVIVLYIILFDTICIGNIIKIHNCTNL